MADDAGTRTLIRGERAPGRNYDLFSSSAPLQVHVDGPSSFSLGPALSRLEFFEVMRSEDGKGLDGQPLEIREQKLVLVMPTLALAEFLVQTIKGLQDNQKDIIQAISGQAQKFDSLVSALVQVPTND